MRKKHFGSKLRELMQRKGGLSQERLAVLMDVSASTVGRWLKDQEPGPSLIQAVALARLFGVPLAHLAYREFQQAELAEQMLRMVAHFGLSPEEALARLATVRPRQPLQGPPITVEYGPGVERGQPLPPMEGEIKPQPAVRRGRRKKPSGPASDPPPRPAARRRRAQ